VAWRGVQRLDGLAVTSATAGEHAEDCDEATNGEDDDGCGH